MSDELLVSVEVELLIGARRVVQLIAYCWVEDGGGFFQSIFFTEY